MTEQTTVTASEEFAGHLMGILNGGALALMLSVGHRTGLFEAVASLPPSTSQFAAARRPIPVCRHRLLERGGRECRPAARVLHVRDLLYALHDGLARRRRYGVGHHVG
jgi:hypothetical protein